jgi:allantoicase
LRECEIIEDYSMKGRSLPGCLVLSFNASKPIHAVIAIDEAHDRIFIVTVYKPSSARWQNGWKTRRHKQ